MKDAALRAVLVRRLVESDGLLEFVRLFWHAVGAGGDFRENWHIDQDCQALEMISREYACAACGARAPLDRGWRRACACGARASWRRVHPATVINQPPGTMKSLLVNVFWPCWHWTFEPEHRWMLVSHGDGIVLRDAGKALQILKDPTYIAAWPRTRLVGGVTAKQAEGNFETTAGGTRYSFSLRGGIIGWHTDTLILDDPLKPEQADAPSGLALEEVARIHDGTLATRRRDPAGFAEVLIMQRLADNDPARLLLDRGAEHICLPMSYVPDCPWDRGHRFGFVDQRTKAGELLWPERFPEDIVARDMAQFTSATAAAQYQQNPTPETGAFFEAAWFKEYESLPRPWELTFLQSWDLGFKGRDRGSRAAVESRSRVHGVLFAWHDPTKRLYLVDERIGRWNYPDTRAVFLAAQGAEPWSRAIAVLVEDKANGSSLISELRELVPSIYPWEPQGSKEDRARRHSARVESGVVWIPRAAWAEEWRGELVRFPRQKANDRVDTATMALDYLYQPGGIARMQLAGLADFFARP